MLLLPLPLSEQTSFMVGNADSEFALIWLYLQITGYLPIRLLLPLLLLLPLPLSEQASFMAAVADSGAQAMHSTT